MRSQQRAAKAIASGYFAKEIVAVEIAGRKGETIKVDRDEHPRETTLEQLAKLKPFVRNPGTVTAGNASGVNDGAAALIIASEAAVKAHGLTPRARILGMASAAVPPRIMGIGPVPATRKLMARLGHKIGDFDVIELNEAFASQSLACLRQLGLADDAAQVNPHGGAIALGHPLGMSGARLALTAAHGLEESGGKLGLATMCVGVGQGVSLALERVADKSNNKDNNNVADLSQGKPERLSQASVAGIQEHGEALAVEAADHRAAHAVRADRAGLRPRRHPGGRQRSDQAAQGRAPGRAHHRARPRLDEDKRPVPETLVEIWQANACGRYVHNVDQHPAPLDPNFTGAGRTVTDKNGYYKFITVKPGAYPWGNHPNAWRPNHIHFSVFGQSFLTRLVTQMYFPGDPLFPFDPIFNSVTDEKARRAWSPASIWKTPFPTGRSASASTSCCAAANRPRRIRKSTNVRHHALTNRRPVLRLWPGAAQPLRLEAERELRLEGNRSAPT